LEENMVKRKFICRKCGYKFEVDIFEEGEAEDKRRPSYPVRCLKCGGPVERV